MPCSVIMRHVSFCCRLEQIEKPKEHKEHEKQRHWNTQPYLECLYQIPPLGLRKLSGRGGRKV